MDELFPSKQWLTVQRAADKLGVHPKTVRDAFDRGVFPHGYRMSTTHEDRRIPIEELPLFRK